ncbi:MAG: ATP-binding cassette domain-containing protein, partial [Microcella pacifica]
HKLREVREVADRITVIRLGKVVGEAEPTATNAELASLMVGRAVDLTVDKAPAKAGDDALIVTGLTVTDPVGQILVNDVSFTIQTGEILAIAGVQGNGQTELTEAIMGLQSHVSGSVVLNGTELLGRGTRGVLDAGVGFVPEDRTEDGLVGTFTIAENLMLDRSTGAPFVKGGTLQLAHLAQFATERVEEFDVRTQGITSPAGSLSGGNQQKVVLARELSRELSLLIAAQPTRGLDVGSIEFVHKRIVATRDDGVPVIVVSTELDEVTALADRIAVMYRGRIIGIVPGDTPRDVLGLMMAGETPAEVAA